MYPHDTPSTKLCAKCGETKPHSDFPLNRARKDGLHSYCKPCNCAAGQAWREKNREYVRQRDRESHAQNREVRNQANREYYRKNRERQKADSLRRSRENKDRAFAVYGGYVCACCGETEPAFLCLDHVNNDGYRHRKEIGRVTIYTWLKSNNYPEGMFQVLCYNCNQGKRINGGVCPHEDNYQTKLQEV